MSTAERELEELRRIREEARLKAIEDQKIADEKAAIRAKKEAFLARAQAFQQKKGPTDEEIKQQVIKESKRRNFGNKLNKRLMRGPPGVGMTTREENEYEAQEYYNEEYASAPSLPSGVRPPPPPPKKLHGINEVAAPPPPPPPPPPSAPGREVEKVASDWVYVFENEPTPYYWNMTTNETALVAPPGYNGAIYSAADYAAPESSTNTRTWQEFLDEAAGEISYWSVPDSNYPEPEQRLDAPEGVAYIVCSSENSEESVYWMEMLDSDSGSTYYYNTVSGESIWDRPAEGAKIIVETLSA